MTSPNDLIRTLPQNFRPEDIRYDDLRHMSKDSFPMWCLTSGVQMDHHPIDFDARRYLLPIYADDNEHIVWQKAAQLGATSYMLLRVLWWLLNHQGRKAGLYFPTKEGVENLSSDRVTPLINSCPEIKEISQEGDKLGLRKIGNSSFYLYHLGGVASKDSVPLDFLTVDEVRLCKASDIDQVQERLSGSEYGNRIFMSTCFAQDTKVFVRAKDTGHVSQITIGELQATYEQYEVLSYNRLGGYRPRWRPILRAFSNGIKPTVKVTFEGGHSVVCTENHKFAVSGAGKPLFGERCFDEIGKIRQYPKASHTAGTERVYSLKKLQTVEGNAYDLRTNEFFGLYIAEGTYQNGTVSIWQNNKTEKNEAARDVVRTWATANGLPFLEKDDGVHVSGLGTRPDLVDLIHTCGGHAPEKRVPPALLIGNEVQMKHLLHGFILGDGHIRAYTKDSSAEFDLYTSSPQLASDLKLVCFKVGTPVSSHRIREGRIGSTVVIAGVETGKANYAEHCLTLNPAGHLHTELLSGMGGLEVRSIEPAATQEVFDLSVDTDHWFFLSESGVLAHNCGMPDNDINARFQLGTQHIWMSKCGCPDGCDLARTFPDCLVFDDPRASEPYYRCPKCKYVIKDPQNGRYVPMNPGADFTSYGVSQLVAKNKTTKPARIWEMFKTTTNMQEFYNAKLGLPYIDEQNIGVTKGMLDAAVRTDLNWRKPGNKSEPTRTCMGIDQGGGYCYVVIADISPDGTKKRIRHLEIIESSNPTYHKQDKEVSPFVRCAELMSEFNVGICVCDMMPNYNEALAFAKQFLGRVFLAWYQKDAKDAIAWNDKNKVKQTMLKAGTLKFKYTVALSRFLSMSFALGEWKSGDVIIPPTHLLVQMCRDEKTNILGPESPGERFFNMMPRLVKKFHATNEETGEGRWDWVYAGGDPHFAHAWNYCTVGLERLRRAPIYSFA